MHVVAAQILQHTANTIYIYIFNFNEKYIMSPANFGTHKIHEAVLPYLKR